MSESPSGLLERTSFELPQDGTLGPAGPFCCTGRTLTIQATPGYPAGYVYFFNIKGQAYDLGDASYAPDASIEIAGLANVHDPSSAMMKGEVDFTAAEMEVGAAKSANVGQLEYTATIDAVDFTNQLGSAKYFDMTTLTVHVDVAEAP